MAKFKAELPKQMMDMYGRLYEHAEEILGEMTQEGAKVAHANIKRNVPSSFLSSDIMHCLYITRPYKTPSDDGINTKVAFYGYFENENGVKTPAPLVCNVFEYGRSTSKFPKHPFLRQSFSQSQIDKAMRRTMKKAMQQHGIDPNELGMSIDE